MDKGQTKSISKPILLDDSCIDFESPAGVEYEGKINSITLYKVSQAKRATYLTLSVLTLGLFALLCFWIEELFIFMNLVKATVSDATIAVVVGEDKSIEILPIEMNAALGEIRFSFRKFGFIYSSEQRMFVPIQFDLSKLTCKDIHTNFAEGLSTEAAEHNLEFYGKNMTEIEVKSWHKLLVEEILNPFYIFQFFSFIVWYLAQYLGFALVVATFTGISVALTLIQTRNFLKSLQKMAKLDLEVNIFRNGDLTHPIKTNSANLAPGDIMEVPEAKVMPCDAILINGLTIMNESMLTGESIPVVKNSLPVSSAHYNGAEDKQYTLYAGTTCIQSRSSANTRVLALVTNTGFMTLKGGLVRSMLFPRKSEFKFYTDALKFIGILAILSFFGLAIDFKTFVMDGYWVLFVQGSQLITITVPPSLPACLSVGISYGLNMLKKKNIFCISPNKIIEAGRIKIMCFDKTGTLTEEGLDLYGVRNVFYDKNTKELCFRKVCDNMQKYASIIADAKKGKAASHPEQGDKHAAFSREEILLNIMATCHSLTLVDSQIYGDPLDIKMFEATQSTLYEKTAENEALFGSAEAMVKTAIGASDDSQAVETKIVRRFEFTSKLQRMSCIVRTSAEPDLYRLHIKGAPEKIRELCRAKSLPENYQEILSKYTNQGLRVLACATKVMKDMSETEALTLERSDLEAEFDFIGFLILQNKLKDITTSIIDKLLDACVRPIMVTGDNALTAISVARQCEIINPTYQVMLGTLQDDAAAPGGKRVIWEDLEFPVGEAEMSQHLSKIEFDDVSERNSAKSAASQDGIQYERLPTIAEQNMNRFSLNRDILSNENEDEISLAMTGPAFSFLVRRAKEEGDVQAQRTLGRVLERALVYARMSPDEKALLVKSLREHHNVMVGMCGDGANDCAALKAANVGISLSEAEASVAAPFTSKTPNISCVVDLFIYGRAALATSIQTFKFMALYSIIEFVSSVSTYYINVYYQNNAYYYIDGALVLMLSFTMSFADAYPKLTIYQPTDRLLSSPIILSVFGLGFIQGFFQVYGLYYVMHASWFNACPVDMLRNVNAACQENTAIFMLSICQYVAVALAVNIGKPFRVSFWQNTWFLFALISLTLLNLILILTNSEAILGLMSLANMPYEFKQFAVIISIVNTVVTIAWEWLIVPLVCQSVAKPSREGYMRIKH